MPSLTLKPGREKSLLRRHPWVFSGAVERVEGDPRSGETIDVLDAKGQFVARAAYSPSSQIRARVWSFDPLEQVDAAFFRRRIQTALAHRATLGFFSPPQARSSLGEGSGRRTEPVEVVGWGSALRLIHAESDQIPGLIVDRYGDVLVFQSLTAGCEFWRETLADILLEETGASAIYERSDADVRELEGLAPRVGLLRGVLPNIPFGHDVDYRISISEYGLKFLVNIESGHKTGFYLDQRRNRHRVGRLAQGRDVLNCFCYTGGFTVHALAGGAKSVLSIDSSADALVLGRENVALNNLPAEKAEWLEGDVFQLLRKLRDQARSFDMIILDPPKFAATAAQAERAARGYKDINLLAFKLLRPGGILVTFSCSGGVDADLFQKIVAGAALDAGVDASIIEHLSQGGDHPVSLHFPEGAYLKGLICLKV
jgi:23S rRNA (cytosine1962-C5)-methyltransferase